MLILAQVEKGKSSPLTLVDFQSHHCIYALAGSHLPYMLVQECLQNPIHQIPGSREREPQSPSDPNYHPLLAGLWVLLMAIFACLQYDKDLRKPILKTTVELGSL